MFIGTNPNELIERLQLKPYSGKSQRPRWRNIVYIIEELREAGFIINWNETVILVDIKMPMNNVCV